MEASSVRAVLFVKDLVGASTFYVGALGMTRVSGDKDHTVLDCDGVELVVHQIPKPIADTIVITQPPVRRVWGAIRLDFPVANVADNSASANVAPGARDGRPRRLLYCATLDRTLDARVAELVDAADSDKTT